MKQAPIAERKARLGTHLRAVRGGESTAVLDRDSQIAQRIPVRERSALRVRKPGRSALPLHRLPLRKRGKLSMDVLRLLEKRQDHR